MHEILHSLAQFFYSLGGVGLVLLGVLDSSFLMLPLGNDLLVVALTAHHPDRIFYYAGMATVGSTLGVCFAHLVSSKIGEESDRGRSEKPSGGVRREEDRAVWGLCNRICGARASGFSFYAIYRNSRCAAVPAEEDGGHHICIPRRAFPRRRLAGAYLRPTGAGDG
jgi:hypothetical protein